MTQPERLSDLRRCFQGVIPTIFSTTDASGVPNVTYLSQVYFVDENHVAVSRQFFNKTSRNLEATRRACAEVYDPVTFDSYRLRLRFLRSETSGPVFDTMALRIQAIASHTGMEGVFRLIAADVFEVVRFEKVAGFLSDAPQRAGEGVSLDGFRSELRGLQWISDRINRASDLESLLAAVLEALESFFHFEHTMVLLHEEPCGKLVALASRGYGESGVGAEVLLGEGLIGTAARERKVLRISGLEAMLRYGRAVRRELQESGKAVTAEIPLPGLPDAQSALFIPLLVGNRLVGVLAAEDRDAVAFGEWHEAYLEIIGNQIALGIDRMSESDDGDDVVASLAAVVNDGEAAGAARRDVVYYREDDSIFVDGEYIIRNVPGRILWKLLVDRREHGRTEFTNRELRLDRSLGLPEVKDNLESRLILLRQRLQEKCPDIRLQSTGRGRFALSLDAELNLVEK